MIYVMINLSSWCYMEVNEIDEETAENIQSHVENGSMVMVVDDLEYACSALHIDVDELKKVDE